MIHLFLFFVYFYSVAAELLGKMNKRVSSIKPTENFKKITLSIGAVITSGIETYEEIFKLVDKQLYVVKNNGKGAHSITKVS